MTVIEPLLRIVAALVLGDPSIGPAPLVAVVAVLGVTAVAVAVLVAHLLAVAFGFDLAPLHPQRGDRDDDLPTRIAWSHPDADGHVRARAPGACTPA